ncbi:N-acetyltransferase B complex non catalytic subunit-domain-containing protein [Xylariales sp. PMI_506]|nr:N-acetyltransferase B complex non catalytic subunit-domain-containing protein [Xylariales sp. PMI_506]
MRLWWTVQINAAGSNDNLKELLKKPQFDALKILSRGYLSVFKDIMQLLETLEVWDEIYRVCREVFDKAIIIMAKEQLEGLSLEEKEQHKKDNKLVEVLGATQDASNAQSQSEAEDRAYSNAAVDLSLWIQFIYASRDQEDKNGSLNLLRHFIDQVIKVTRLPRFYQKQKAIANLTILFAGFESSDVLAGKEQASSTRVDQLVAYVSAHYRLVSCFSDIKQYVEKLRADEAKEFLQRLSQEYENADNDAFKNVVLQSLHLRFRYLLTTTDQAPSVDLTPGSPWKTEIEAIAKACATVYNKGVLDKEVRDRVSSSDVDPFSDVAIIGATCLLKLAGLTSNEDATQGASLQSADLKLILQAIAWLAKQYDAFPIKSQELPVLLTKLYFLIGCITQAKKVWATLDIKNVTLDSLGPLFADRLSTVAPGLWTSGSTTTPMFPYVKYYTDAHKRSIPSNVRNALETGSCGSALGIMNLQARLRHSCTLLMAAVEDRRGVRAATGKSIYPIDRDPLLRHITLSSDLVNATDYDSLPNHESSKGHLSNIVNLGPSLSAPRVKLALFTEELLSVISYRDPKDYKPAKAAAAAEQEKRFSAQEADKLSLAIEETLRQCKESAETSWPVLTEAELAYFGIVSQLAAIVALYARGGLAKNAPRPAHSGDMVAAAVASLQDQIDAASSAFAGAEANNNDEDNDNNNKEVLYGFATLHTLGMLRESATAMKLTAAFVEKTVGNASASAPKWVAEDLRALHDGAGAGAELVRKRVKVLNEAAAGRAWLDTVCGWAFGDLATSDVADEAGSGLEAAVFAAAGGRAGLEITAGQIKDSWQEVAKGWAQIKLD